jgi:hypothetical protein
VPQINRPQINSRRCNNRGIQNLVDGLTDSDDQYAYRCLKQLAAENSRSVSVYLFFAVFAGVLNHVNSYVRSRAIILIAANAKWDTDYKIDEIIDQYLKHIMDEKPITARQCIKSLPLIARYKPELKELIIKALQTPGNKVHYMVCIVYCLFHIIFNQLYFQGIACLYTVS